MISKGRPHACPLTTLAINIYGPQCLINIVLTIKYCQGKSSNSVISMGRPHACLLTTLAIDIYGPSCLINIF